MNFEFADSSDLSILQYLSSSVFSSFSIEIYFSNIRSIEVLLSPVPYSIHTSDGNQQPVALHRLKELVTGDWGLHPGCVAVLLTTW